MVRYIPKYLTGGYSPVKSDVCMLASEDIVLELKAKKENLEREVCKFEDATSLEPNKIVECCLYKTALRACELVTSDHPFLLYYYIYKIFFRKCRFVS